MLFAWVELTCHEDPALVRPGVVEAAFDVNGRLVRAPGFEAEIVAARAPAWPKVGRMVHFRELQEHALLLVRRAIGVDALGQGGCGRPPALTRGTSGGES